jgi:hypothetical protein
VSHTPGPWEIFDSEIIASNSDVNIADLRLCDGMDPCEWQANQRLIAAAPDLLSALKALTQDSRFNLAIGGNPNAVAALVKQVDLAIAKAEGL